MRKFLKFGVFALLGMALTFGANSCSDDDPDYSNVTPPKVAMIHNISGRVTGVNGDGLTATVSMDGTSVTTHADGTFVFENVSSGTHTLKAEASGKMPKETSVTVNSGSNAVNPVWNVTLSNAGTEIAVNADGSAEGSVVSETLKGNETGEIKMTLTAPEGAVASGNEIIVTPLYSLEEANATVRSIGTKATGSTLLIGTKVSCSDASATLQEDLTLEYDVDPELATTITAQKYVNGQWVDTKYQVDNGKVTVTVDQFTSYSLLCNATISTSVSSEALTFNPNSWDNLYGSSEMTVTSSSYTYHIGTDITTSGTNRITAYLIEILARAAGAGVTTATGTYPINVTLPIGTAMSISGEQEVATLTASMLNRSVSGKQYGTVSVITTAWNRNHTGGSNMQN